MNPRTDAANADTHTTYTHTPTARYTQPHTNAPTHVDKANTETNYTHIHTCTVANTQTQTQQEVHASTHTLHHCYGNT